jgi:PKD repeat protein
VACAGFSSAVFRADAGTTYYIQLAAGFFASSPIELSVRVAPPAMANFFYYPSDPSSLDTVQFHDISWDVAQIASRLWGFGDGATAADCCPSHRYAADGEYEAKLAITTTDGRSASATRNVAVKTHDVAITKLAVPNTARVGQSREITVGVQNTRYAETVEVALLRSVPGGGFEHVGQVTQAVPARAKGRATTFSLAYTFTPEDAVLGKVTFQAIATIVGARDANPADNTISAPPTKVAR